MGNSVGAGITPVVSGVASITQQVGAASGVGAPVNSLVNNIGGAVASLGSQIGASGGNPVSTQLGARSRPWVAPWPRWARW
nr:collagen-like triple helix repeat-containing protein [Pseudomonas brassicae]